MPIKIKRPRKRSNSEFTPKFHRILDRIIGGIHGEHSYYYFGRIESAAIKEGLLATGITSADAFRDYLLDVFRPEEEIPFWCDVVLTGAEEARKVDWGLSGNSQ